MKTDFQVEVKKDKWENSSRPHILNITNNGHQWTQMGFATIDDIRKTRDALDKYIKTHETP